MHPALLGGGSGLGPNQKIKIKLLEPRLAHFAYSDTGQHANPNNVSSPLVFIVVQSIRQSVNLVFGKKSFSGIFQPSVEPRSRIVFAPAPFDGKAEGFSEGFTHTVGPYRRFFGALEFSGTIVGFSFMRPRSSLGDFSE